MLQWPKGPVSPTGQLTAGELRARAAAQSGGGAAPVDAVGASRYWRIKPFGEADGGALSFGNIQMRETIGGADEVPNRSAIISAGLNTSSSFFFDNNPNTRGWISSNNIFLNEGWIGVDFGEGVTKTIRQVVLTSPASFSDACPAGFFLQRSDDLSEWITTGCVLRQSWFWNSGSESRAYDFSELEEGKSYFHINHRVGGGNLSDNASATAAVGNLFIVEDEPIVIEKVQVRARDAGDYEIVIGTRSFNGSQSVIDAVLHRQDVTLGAYSPQDVELTTPLEVAANTGLWVGLVRLGGTGTTNNGVSLHTLGPRREREGIGLYRLGIATFASNDIQAGSVSVTNLISTTHYLVGPIGYIKDSSNAGLVTAQYWRTTNMDANFDPDLRMGTCCFLDINGKLILPVRTGTFTTPVLANVEKLWNGNPSDFIDFASGTSNGRVTFNFGRDVTPKWVAIGADATRGEECCDTFDVEWSNDGSVWNSYKSFTNFGGALSDREVYYRKLN